MPGKLRSIARHFTPSLRERSATLRRFSNSIGLVYFGGMDQNDDDYDPIRGFSASIHHTDHHYAVGTYNGFDVRLVDRFDSYKGVQNKKVHHSWIILEVNLEAKDIPHVFFVPTGHAGGAYERLYVSQPHLQPLNSLLTNRSPEFHGRYQILARTTYSHSIDTLFSSPLIVGIATRFWPHGIEVQNGKLYVYIAGQKVTKHLLESALGSALWLAQSLDGEDA